MLLCLAALASASIGFVTLTKAEGFQRPEADSPMLVSGKMGPIPKGTRLDTVPPGYISSNKENTQFKGRLYWPTNTSDYQIGDAYNWEKFMEDPSNPRYGGLLPHYGLVSPIEVNDDINAVWNMTKGLKHIPGEKLESISRRIQGPITEFIKAKDAARLAAGLEPVTKAHRIVIRAAGNETFVAMNMYNGDHGLRSGPVTKPAQAQLTSGQKDKDCQWSLDAAQQILDLKDPKGTCGYHTAVLTSLHHKAGLLSFDNTVQCRPTDWRGGYVESDKFRDGGNWLHSTIVLILPSVDDARGLSKKWSGPYYSTRYASAQSDPTFYSIAPQDREAFRKSKVFPQPEHFLVGAKGDSVLMVRHTMSYMSGGLDYNARETRGFLKWDVGNFFKADVNSVRTLIASGVKLTEQIVEGR